jgi:hypothetical protein
VPKSLKDRPFIANNTKSNNSSYVRAIFGGFVYHILFKMTLADLQMDASIYSLSIQKAPNSDEI